MLLRIYFPSPHTPHKRKERKQENQEKVLKYTQGFKNNFQRIFNK